jgi:hypothetical protein
MRHLVESARIHLKQSDLSRDQTRVAAQGEALSCLPLSCELSVTGLGFMSVEPAFLPRD